MVTSLVLNSFEFCKDALSLITRQAVHLQGRELRIKLSLETLSVR